jgi:RNA polymerase sigma-70 factor (ECF subfamily)
MVGISRNNERPATDRWFTATHWSVVLAAARKETPQAAESLEQLCRTYWPALYAYIRREGYGAAEAEDLTQDFFAHLLRHDFLARVNQPQGKFRSFLLTWLKHFLADARDKAQAQKRGGGLLLSLEAFADEERARCEPVDGLTPDQVFDRCWAETLLARAQARLRDEYVARGRRELFELISDLEPGTHGEIGYAAIGQRLGLSAGGVKTAVHRLRRRYREILREEVAQTVSRPEEMEEEVRHLLTVGRPRGG